jgi:hypothetical protein
MDFFQRTTAKRVCVLLGLVVFLSGCGGGGSSLGGNNGGGGGGNNNGTVPGAPTSLMATAGNQQVALSWTASSGATSYHVKRGTTTGGPYTQIAAPTSASYTDTTVANGTTYYYVVSALNSVGESANSNEASALPVGTVTVHVNVDVLNNRHAISPYVYGGSYPQDAAHVTDSGITTVRWGGNSTSTYNWQLHTNNADNDYYFENFNANGFNNGTDGDSVQWINDVKAAGGVPLATMTMLPWVAQTAETSTQQGNGSNNFHWSFSVSKYGTQCHTDPFNSDAGDGLKTDCSTQLSANPNDAYVPLLDQPGSSDPAGSVYRNQWAAALAAAFSTSPHFYDMDNEVDIWGGTHFDIHPAQVTYDELRDTYLLEARNLKTWDPAAIRLGPVSCCWWFYWNSGNNNEKAAHGNLDMVPWWLNEVYWHDQIDGVRSLDVFDLHAYPDSPSDLSTETTAQKQASSIRVYREWWDPTYTSENTGSADQVFTTSIQPQRTMPFRIPRMKALVNTIYPGTKFSFTEWSTGFADVTNITPPHYDFSTALSDAMGYGILGKENVYLASRWTAQPPTAPGYFALKIYRNYDGSHSSFGDISVGATNDGNPSTFGAYAAVNSSSGKMTIMVVNGDPGNSVQAQFVLNGFTAANVTSYTFSSSSPTAISASSSQPWSSTQTFAPYTITLLVISGTPTTPGTELELNPTEIFAPAGGTATLAPQITSGTGTVTLSSAAFDAYEGASACTGTIDVTASTITTTAPGSITLNAGTTPGFCHFTVTGTDGTSTQTQGGWLLVGNPAATLTNDTSTGTPAAGAQVTLSVTLNPGSSIGSPVCGNPPCSPSLTAGADVLFTVDSGTLSGGNYGNATQQIATTNSSGIASVTLMVPNSSGTVVHVTAEGPYELGHPEVKFSETAQ